jgi:TetR/AcrR family transcriptional regulator
LKTRNPEQTRTAVLAAAERLFSERGFAGTSMRDLAHASGISQPLIHHHFGSKEALYSAVKQRALEQLRALWMGKSSVVRPLKIEQRVRLLVEFYRKNPQLLRLLSWARLEGDVNPWPGEAQAGPVARDPLMMVAALLFLFDGVEA